jgi:hypothetical protein
VALKKLGNDFACCHTSPLLENVPVLDWSGSYAHSCAPLFNLSLHLPLQLVVMVQSWAFVFNHLLSVSGTHDCGYSRNFKKPSLFFF